MKNNEAWSTHIIPPDQRERGTWQVSCLKKERRFVQGRRESEGWGRGRQICKKEREKTLACSLRTCWLTATSMGWLWLPFRRTKWHFPSHSTSYDGKLEIKDRTKTVLRKWNSSSLGFTVVEHPSHRNRDGCERGASESVRLVQYVKKKWYKIYLLSRQTERQ